MPLSLRDQFHAAATPPEGWQGFLGFADPKTGRNVRYGFAPAQTEQRHGTMILLHGYNESVDLYYEKIKLMQRKGYDVWAMDLPGFGRSDRFDPNQPDKLDPNKNLESYADTLQHFVQNIVRRDNQQPLMLSTHSMSGHIANIHLQKYPDTFSGVIMSAPMLDIYRLGLPSAFRPLIRSMFNVASHIGLRDVATPSIGYDSLMDRIKGVSRSLKSAASDSGNMRLHIREAMNALMPESQVERPTFGWIANAFKSITKYLKPDTLKAINTPVLIGSAGRENLVDNSAHSKAADLMPHARHIYLPKAQHNLWHETGESFEQWSKAVDQFIGDVEQGRAIAKKPAPASFAVQQNPAATALLQPCPA